MLKGKKRRDRLDICKECEKAARPAISAARLGHTKCLATAYRELDVFNERDDYGATPIHYAARSGQLECLKWLVTRSGISPNAVSSNGANAAHDAAAMGHLDCLKYLLQTTRCTTKDSTVEGATVLHMACRFGRLDAVQWLIEHSGSDPSEKGANDVTPVHLCAAKNHLECLKWLTQHSNYVPNQRTVHGATAVYFAAQEGSLECLEWLVNHGSGDPYLTATDGMSPIHAAAQAGQIPCMEWLVNKAGVSPRYKAEDGATPAHFAAASGQVECLNWILDNGGSVLDRDNLGGTPVHDAAEQGQVGTLSVLIQHGVDVMAADDEGLRPLDLAQDNNHEDCVQLLFKALKPSLLRSLTPHHSLSRASAAGEDKEQVELQAEKQRQFEAAMMEGVSEARMSAMWESAQQSAPTGLQPGLRQILNGEVPDSASQFSLDRIPTTPLVPTGSRRHSRHSTLRSTQRSAIGSKRSTSADEDFKENLTLYKPRPALSPDLFLQPQGEGGGDIDLHPATKKPRTDAPQQKSKPPNAFLRPIQDPLQGMRPSPIPQRAKFLKKFNLSKNNKGGAPKMQKPKKKDKKKKSLADKKGMEEGSVIEATAAAKPSETTAVIVTDERDRPLDTQFSATKQETTPTDTKQETTPTGMKQETTPTGTKQETTPTGMKQETTPTGTKQETTPTGTKQETTPTGTKQETTPTGTKQETTPTGMKQETTPTGMKQETTPTGTKQETTPTGMKQETTPNSTWPEPAAMAAAPYEVVAESIVSQAPQETTQGTVKGPPEEPTPARPATPPPPVRVVLREKEKKKKKKEKAKAKRTSYEEEAVIGKQRGSRSLQNPEETVTVSFLPKASNIKKPFPVTHTRLLSDADLSSPGSSDDEETGRESFTTPGFIRLDPQAFEQFGLDVKAIDQLREEKEKEWKDSMEKLDDVSQETDSTLQGGEPSGDVVKKLDLDAGRELAAVSGDGKPKSPLTKWRNLRSLDKIDRMGDRDAESVSSDDTFIVHEDQEKPGIQEYGSKAVYNKIPDRQSGPERKSSEVAKLVGHIETKRKSAPTPDPPEKAPTFAGIVRSGSVSEKLKMFGGGGGAAKPEPKKERGVMDSQKQQARALKEKQRALGEKMRAAGLVEETDAKPISQPVLGPKNAPAFEAIREETGSSSEKGEGEDRVAPLPRIHAGQGRRHSQERLKLDGLTPPPESGGQQVSSKPVTRKSASVKQPLSIIQNKEPSDVEKARLSPIMRKKKSASAVYSPLMISSEAGRKDSRPVSSPQNAKSHTLYMNSANLPHLNYLQERHVKDETERAEEVAERLLRSVWDKGSKVPLEFKGLEVKAKEKIYVWRQKAGSLNKVTSLEAVTFDPNSVFVFLKCYPWGPLFSHIFLWVGGAVGSFGVQSSYQHCQRLAVYTPGRPVLHREFQGHESFLFCEAVGGELMVRHERSLQYLNTDLYKARLHSFNQKTSSFVEISPPLAHTSITGDSPLILDTPTQLFLWLPMSYWEGKEEQKAALEIAEMFISSQSYPKWTPVTVVTEQAEPATFSAHFPFWSSPNLALTPRARELGLPRVRAPEVTYPATGQTKIWYVHKGVAHEIPLDRIGHFDSDRVYLVQYNYRKQSSLYTWLECALYVWVGQDVGGGELTLKEAIACAESISPSKQPLVLVPEGKEPEQLLTLFKGRFIVHRKKVGSVGGVQLFQISGTAALRMRAIEVPPVSSSLHSSHTFLLMAGEKVFSWSGQFSSQAERRGALIIAKLMGNKSEPTKLPEGMETPDFWKLLKGKGRYQHFTAPEYPAYSLPVFYSCRVERGTGGVVFRQTPPKKKEELQSNRSYLMQFKDKLFLWLGSKCEEVSPPDIIKSYTQQYHSWKSSYDFLVTVVWESHEGEAFWKWFTELQNIASAETTPPTPSVEEGGNESVHEGEVELTRLDDEIEEETADGEGDSVEGVDGDVVEDGKNEATKDTVAESADVTLRDPPSSQPLSLTQSQETTFEKVGRLQADLEALVEGGEGEGEGEDQVSPVSPFRTSQAVKQLSDMIEGLDSMMDNIKARSPTIAKKPSPDKPDDTSQTGLTAQLATTGKASATDDASIPTPPVDDLVAQLEDNLLEQPQEKIKPKRSAPKPPKMVMVPVEVEGGRVCEVTVRETAPVISVMFKVAETAGVKLATNSAIFEISESLRIQRALEDHELIRDVMTAWPSKNKPHLLLREFATKYSLWTPTPPIPKSAISAYLKQGKVPELTAQFQHSRRGNKLQWIQGTYCLRPLGIYTADTRKPGELSASLDHTLYTPVATRGKNISVPTPFCFVMKPASSWKEKDMKLYCAPNLHTMAQWVHALRLLKHGLQLKGNFIAMKNRLQKRTDLQKQETAP